MDSSDSVPSMQHARKQQRVLQLGDFSIFEIR